MLFNPNKSGEESPRNPHLFPNMNLPRNGGVAHSDSLAPNASSEAKPPRGRSLINNLLNQSRQNLALNPEGDSPKPSSHPTARQRDPQSEDSNATVSDRLSTPNSVEHLETPTFPPKDIPMADDDSNDEGVHRQLLPESQPSRQHDPSQYSQPFNQENVPLQHYHQEQPENVPLMAQYHPPPPPLRLRDRDSSPFMLPVQDLSALPLGTNYGWRVED